MTLGHGPGDIANAFGPQRISRNATHRHIHRRAGGACAVQRGRQIGLQRHHPGPLFKPGRQATNQTAATDTDQHAARQPGLGLDLGAECGRTGHHLHLVVSVHQHRAANPLALQTGFIGLGITFTCHGHCRAELAQPIALGLAGDGRYKHLAGHAQRLRRRRSGNARVATRGNDHAGSGNRLGQHAVEHAARLEAAAHLQVLELEPDLGAVHAHRPATQLPQWRFTQKVPPALVQPTYCAINIRAFDVSLGHGVGLWVS